MNVFSELIHSVYDLKSYGIFLKDKKRKTFLFGFLLVLLYYLVTVILPFVQFQVSTGGIGRVVEEFLPEFTIADSKLQVDGQFELDEGDVYVFVDTEHELLDNNEIQKILRRYNTVLVANEESLVIKSNNQIQYLEFSQMDPEFEMTKSGLIDMFLPFVNVAIAAVLVVVFLFMQGTFFFGVLFVGLFGMIVASCMKSNLTFGQLYKLGVYTRTTPLLIKGLVSFLPFSIPLYFVISIGISLGYLVGAIRKMETPDLEGNPVVFYSDEMKDRWSRPEDSDHGWNK